MIRPLLQKPPFAVRTLRHFELIPGPAVPMSLAVPFADESIEMDALRKCAANGDDGSQLDLASRYRDGKGVEKDKAEAMPWAHRAADAGHADTTNFAGFAYLGGAVVQRKTGIAFGYFKAAAPESAQAAFNLGQCYCGAQSNAILSRPAFFIENR